MKLTLSAFLFTLLFIGSNSVSAQVYSEDFDGALTWTLNTVVGAEGVYPNEWFISCDEEGVGAGSCGTGCTSGNQTLYVSLSAALGGPIGAAYFEAGSGTTNSERMAESGDINTVGESGMTLDFDFIGWGGNPSDYTELVYSIDGGGSWIVLDPDLQTNCCGDVACTGGLQGLWATNSYSLPSTCEGLTDFRIGFIWHNLDDLIATDPSFAVDNIVISAGGPCTTPPVSAFAPGSMTICAEDGITFTDASTSCDVITDWAWDFPSGSPSSATGPGPHTPTWSTPGDYTVTLTVTDGVGSNDSSITITVEAEPVVGPDNSTTVCNSSGTIDVNTLLSGADPLGVWTETTSSGSFDSGTGVFTYTGLTAGDYIFEYTITPVACSPATATITVTVAEQPDAGLDSSIVVCNDGIEVDLDDLLSGADVGGVWTETTSSGTFDPGTAVFPYNGLAEGNYDFVYTVSGISPCLDDFANFTVTVREFNYAGSDTAITVCDSDGTLDLFSVLGGTFDLGGSWNDDDATGALTGSSLNLAIPPAPGTYNFTYDQDNSDPCADDAATVTVSIQHCLSIEENESPGLDIYPNPVTNLIDLTSFNLDIQFYEILDVSGKLIISGISDQINVEKLAVGAYFLKVYTPNVNYSEQFVKE